MNLPKNNNNDNFDELLTLIVSSKQKAYSNVNKILVELYWNIGKYISIKIKQNSWGKNIVEELAYFIKEKEPNIKGFTARNMWRMKQFYEIYKNNEKLSALLTQLTWTNNLLILSLNRSMSPAIISKYETQLIPKELLQQKLNELYEQYKTTMD